MQLTTEQLRAVTWGAVRVLPERGGTGFHRFTEAQEAFYLERSPNDFYPKCFATSGVRLAFRTDSRYLRLVATLERATSRKYAALEVFVNGTCAGCLDNYSGEDMSPDYTGKALPLDELCGSFDLGPGEKEVTVYLPWSLRTVLRSVELDDGAGLTPVQRQKKLLVFGDSISQGYDALRPSCTYTAQLANRLNAQELNKAIGGEHFIPGLAALQDDIEPDYIVIAYGTNDWSHRTVAELSESSATFYRTVSRLYPNARIFALAPIWREDYLDPSKACLFRQLPNILRVAANGLPNVTVVDCFDFVPQDVRLYADLRLHPSDVGFAHYAGKLAETIGNLL